MNANASAYAAAAPPPPVATTTTTKTNITTPGAAVATAAPEMNAIHADTNSDTNYKNNVTNTRNRNNSDDGDDLLSFKSCVSNDDNSNYHDHHDAYRFPNGYKCYEVNDPSFKPSWVMLQVHSKQCKGETKGNKKYFYSCLGVYECPVSGCNFISNPVQPRKKFYGANPEKAKSDLCRIHQQKLVHIQCHATMTLKRSLVLSCSQALLGKASRELSR
eukprot:scaffold9534_cov84-Skeletonema_menzelii.AAC.1